MYLNLQRDSGGVLYWTVGRRKYAAGIVSSGVACASEFPSVNTRITSYIGWIEKKLISTNLFCRK